MGFFQQVIASFTNFDSYKVVAFQRSGRTLKYFFLLFTLVFILGSIRIAYDMTASFSEALNTVKENLPEFSLKNGELNVEGPQPIILGGENNTALVIDTTGKTNETILDNYNEGVFISKHELFTKQNYQVKKINFSAFKTVTLNKEKLVQWLPVLKWLIIILGLIGYLFSLVWALMTTALLAMLGTFMVKQAVRSKINFSKLWNIAVYAMTLPWILEMVKNLIYPGLPIFFAIKWGTAIFIMYKAVEAVSDNLIEELP